MGYFAYLIALLRLAFADTKGLTANEGIKLYLSFAEKLNYAFIWVCVAIWVIVFLLFALSFFRGRYNSVTWGCQTIFMALFMIFLPLIQWVVWRLNLGMLNNFGPQGPTDVKFWICLIITALMSSG